MCTTIICNDFSLHMLIEDCVVRFKKIPLNEFLKILQYDDFISCIGDRNIANVLKLKHNKSNILLDDSTRLVVAKFVGGVTSQDVRLIENFEFYDIEYFQDKKDELKSLAEEMINIIENEDKEYHFKKKQVYGEKTSVSEFKMRRKKNG